ncbi:MAG: CbbX protein, partial [Pseudonocardia sp.]
MTPSAPRQGFAMGSHATAPGQARDSAEADGADEVLPPDATVDLAEVRRDTGVDDVLAALDRELVGLAPVKARIAELAALLLVDRTRVRFGVPTPRPTLHMSFTGSPG